MTDPWTAAFIVIVTNIHSGNAMTAKAFDADGPWYFKTQEACEQHLVKAGPEMVKVMRKHFPLPEFDMKLYGQCEL